MPFVPTTITVWSSTDTLFHRFIKAPGTLSHTWHRAATQAPLFPLKTLSSANNRRKAWLLAEVQEQRQLPMVCVISNGEQSLTAPLLPFLNLDPRTDPFLFSKLSSKTGARRERGALQLGVAEAGDGGK